MRTRSGYGVQSLRMGRDRQCKTNPIHAVTAGLVRNARSCYTRCGYEEGRTVPKATITSLRIMASRRRQGLQVSEARLDRPAHGVPM
jgi:hypothetical protein